VGRPRHRIAIVQRPDARRIPNADAVVGAVRAVLAKAGVSSQVTLESFDQRTLEWQIRMVRDCATVLVAVDGAALDNAMFMPEGGGVVVLARDVRIHGQRHPFMHGDVFAAWREGLGLEIESVSRPPGGGTGPIQWQDPDAAAAAVLGVVQRQETRDANRVQ
jgi:hypothetical protein